MIINTTKGKLGPDGKQSHADFQNRLDNHKNNLGNLQNQIQDTSTNHNNLVNYNEIIKVY